MDPRITLPPHLVAQARRFSDGTEAPAEPRNAATVILMRRGATEAPGSLEVYFLRRVVDMAFAGGMAVFPGGGVDARDFPAHEEGTADIGWAGPPPEEWAERLGTDVALAQALVCAAVRETFEESGVLLAGPSADSVVADTTGEDWEADRLALESRELSFTEFLRRRSLLLRTDLLAPWACWLTPTFEPRRYRTWFFAAALPEGQVTRDVSTESEEVMWLAVGEALLAAQEHRLLMLPPQYCTCLELYDAASPAEAQRLARERELNRVEPSARFDGDEALLEVPERLVRLAADVSARLTA